MYIDNWDIPSPQSTSDVFINPHFVEGDIELPKYLRDTEGNYLLTPGLVHLVYGKPGSRKSFFALEAVLQHQGIYVDFETHPRAMRRRLRRLPHPIHQANYFAYLETPESIINMVEVILSMEPTVVVIDSMGELMSRFGYDTSNDMDVANIFRQVIKPLARANHAVVVIDHLPKSTSNDHFPFGSQNKKSQSDVLFLLTDNGLASEIRLTKDRDYIFGERGFNLGDDIGYIEVSDNPTEVRVHPYKSGGVKSLYKLSPLVVMKDRIMRACELLGPQSKSELRKIVGGNNAVSIEAVEALIICGNLKTEKVRTTRGGNAQLLSVARPDWEYSPGTHLIDIEKRAQQKAS
jgi:hypothetical protein